MRHGAALYLEVFVDGPDGDVAFLSGIELPHGDPLARIRSSDARVRREAARLPKVTKERALVRAVLNTSVQLRCADNRKLQLLSEDLQRARDLGHFLLPVLGATRGLHQLQVVDDDQA